MAEKNVEYPVPCPLVDGKMVDMDICFLTHCVVDQDEPEFITPHEMRKKPAFREICKACKYHRDD